jgi:hypothetical protein
MPILHQSTCRRTWLSGLGLTGLGLRMWGGSPMAATAQTKTGNESPVERETVCQAMKLAATYYRTQVARHGGYVYHYDLDLKRSWGEGEASSHQIQVDVLRAEYLQLRQPASRAEVATPTTNEPSAGTIQDWIEALDPHGRWLSYSQGERLVGQKVFPPGTPYLSSQLFSQNLSQLASYVTEPT